MERVQKLWRKSIMGFPNDTDYDTPQGMADAEEAIRQAIADLFLAVAADYGFTNNHVQIVFRAVTTPEEFDIISMIDDPDTADEDAADRRKLERHFYIDQRSFKRTPTELTYTYGLHIFYGFKDEYAKIPAGRRSLGELYALNTKFEKMLADNQTLGLDERISHSFLQMPSKPRWLPQDSQGNSTTVIDDTLAVVLRVC